METCAHSTNLHLVSSDRLHAKRLIRSLGSHKVASQRPADVYYGIKQASARRIAPGPGQCDGCEEDSTMGKSRPRKLRRARSRWPSLAGTAVAAASLSFGLTPASQTVLAQTVLAQTALAQTALAQTALAQTVLAQTTPTTVPAPPPPSSSWAIVPSPNTANSRGDDLTSVSCTAGPACMAVGHSFGSGEKALAESWDGSAWSIVPTPDAGDTTNPLVSNVLNGVSCVSDQACTAVGEYVGASGWQTLIESWDGSTWSIVPSPSVSPSLGTYLDGVSCLSATFCTAV